MKKYRTGIAGSAHIHSHLYSLSTVPNIELVAAVAQIEVKKNVSSLWSFHILSELRGDVRQ